MSWLTRLWERVRNLQQSEPAREAALVHMSPDRYGYPLCGARLGSPWAMNVEAVTCEACRKEGLLIHIQHWCNTR